MNFAVQTTDISASSLAVVDDVSSLSAFLDTASAATIWSRSVPAHVQTWLDRLDTCTLPKGRIILRPCNTAPEVAHLCDMSHMPESDERNWLLRDIAQLADRFAGLMSTDYLRLRMDVIANNACHKFHKDTVSARLICTYRGSGTQYGFSAGKADPQQIFQVATGAPLLLRGTLWPEDPPSGLLHRSPPIAGTCETRLVLVLDPVSNSDGDP